MNKSGNISHTVRSVVLIIAVIFITADLVTLAPDDHARHRTTTANRQKDNQRSEDPDRRRNMITVRLRQSCVHFFNMCSLPLALSSWIRMIAHLDHNETKSYSFDGYC